MSPPVMLKWTVRTNYFHHNTEGLEVHVSSALFDNCTDWQKMQAHLLSNLYELDPRKQSIPWEQSSLRNVQGVRVEVLQWPTQFDDPFDEHSPPVAGYLNDMIKVVDELEGVQTSKTNVVTELHHPHHHDLSQSISTRVTSDNYQTLLKQTNLHVRILVPRAFTLVFHRRKEIVPTACRRYVSVDVGSGMAPVTFQQATTMARRCDELLRCGTGDNASARPEVASTRPEVALYCTRNRSIQTEDQPDVKERILTSSLCTSNTEWDAWMDELVFGSHVWGDARVFVPYETLTSTASTITTVPSISKERSACGDCCFAFKSCVHTSKTNFTCSMKDCIIL